MSKTRGKILVADTVEELEQQLRDNAAPPAAELPGRKSQPTPDDEEPEDPPVQDPDPEEIDSPPVDDPRTPAPAVPLTPPGVPAGAEGLRRYESRIHVVEAWKYPGNLQNKPAFIDPNWVSWMPFDEKNGYDAGPALAVPTSGPYPEKMCRKGDYVVRQLVTIDHSLPQDPQLDVWTEAEFERMFIPAEKNP